ncbi:sortase [Dehalobacterium formicoaceticum]|uniref:Class E sortase n=1 Tax=Dehalobacterium formicoaceticum TaxID=51515 RepID=A0ABT1Y1M2_9FIRM|nr:class E sortase [Dehalobacterium formicoaceticum]MCR6544761.1 class E sortase [Dehalobacterium formicoaceticum]
MLYPFFTSIYSRIGQWYLTEEDVPFQDTEYPGLIDSGQEPPAIEEKEPTQLEKQMIMKLEIPAINLAVGVVQGTRPKDLRIGPGWYQESALPGKGNTAIAGHLNIYGSWFRNLDKLQEGDVINLTYQGNTYVYQTEKVFSIASDDWTVIQPRGYNALTLTTCDSQGRDQLRLAVQARLID